MTQLSIIVCLGALAAATITEPASASECKDKVVSFSNSGYSCAHYMGTHISRTQYGYNPPWCNGTTVNDTRFQKDNKAGVALNGEGADGACCGCGGGIQVEPTTNAPVTEAPLTAGEGIQVEPTTNAPVTEAPLTAGEGIQVTGTSTATPTAAKGTIAEACTLMTAMTKSAAACLPKEESECPGGCQWDTTTEAFPFCSPAETETKKYTVMVGWGMYLQLGREAYQKCSAAKSNEAEKVTLEAACSKVGFCKVTKAGGPDRCAYDVLESAKAYTDHFKCPGVAGVYTTVAALLKAKNTLQAAETKLALQKSNVEKAKAEVTTKCAADAAAAACTAAKEKEAAAEKDSAAAAAATLKAKTTVTDATADVKDSAAGGASSLAVSTVVVSLASVAGMLW